MEIKLGSRNQLDMRQETVRVHELIRLKRIPAASGISSSSGWGGGPDAVSILVVIGVDRARVVQLLSWPLAELADDQLHFELETESVAAVRLATCRLLPMLWLNSAWAIVAISIERVDNDETIEVFMVDLWIVFLTYSIITHSYLNSSRFFNERIDSRCRNHLRLQALDCAPTVLCRKVFYYIYAYLGVSK